MKFTKGQPVFVHPNYKKPYLIIDSTETKTQPYYWIKSTDEKTHYVPEKSLESMSIPKHAMKRCLRLIVNNEERKDA